MTTIYKYPQFILAIDRTFIESQNIQEGLTSIDIFKFAEEVAPYLSIRQRDYLDGNGRTHFGNKDYLQVIPYFTVNANILDIDTKEPINKLTMVYQRTKVSGESRLMGNYSIGLGGHVDLADVVFNEDSVIDFIETLKNCLEREAQEELNHPSNFERTTKFTGKVLLDYSNEVGHLHIGFIFNMEHDVVEGPDMVMLITSDVEAATVGYYPLEGLQALLIQSESKQKPDFEEWSKIIIKDLVSQKEKE